MSHVQPAYDDLLRIFREEIDAHLRWQDAQEFYGLLTSEPGWRRPAWTVFEELQKVSGKISTPRFQKALGDFYELYAH